MAVLSKSVPALGPCSRERFFDHATRMNYFEGGAADHLSKFRVSQNYPATFPRSMWSNRSKLEISLIFAPPSALPGSPFL